MAIRQREARLGSRATEPKPGEGRSHRGYCLSRFLRPDSSPSAPRGAHGRTVDFPPGTEDSPLLPPPRVPVLLLVLVSPPLVRAPAPGPPAPGALSIQAAAPRLPRVCRRRAPLLGPGPERSLVSSPAQIRPNPNSRPQTRGSPSKAPPRPCAHRRGGGVGGGGRDPELLGRLRKAETKDHGPPAARMLSEALRFRATIPGDPGRGDVLLGGVLRPLLLLLPVAGQLLHVHADHVPNHLRTEGEARGQRGAEPNVGRGSQQAAPRPITELVPKRSDTGGGGQAGAAQGRGRWRPGGRWPCS